MVCRPQAIPSIQLSYQRPKPGTLLRIMSGRAPSQVALTRKSNRDQTTEFFRNQKCNVFAINSSKP